MSINLFKQEEIFDDITQKLDNIEISYRIKNRKNINYQQEIKSNQY